MKKKMNNKGFSLVELIIVIAIMVVLGVVVALALTKYPEQAKKATDTENATSICTALQIWAVDPDRTDALNGGSVTVSDTGTSPSAGFATNALSNAGFPTTTKAEGTWTNAKSYTINFTFDTAGAIAFTYSPTDFSNEMTHTKPATT